MIIIAPPILPPGPPTFCFWPHHRQAAFRWSPVRESGLQALKGSSPLSVHGRGEQENSHIKQNPVPSNKMKDPPWWTGAMLQAKVQVFTQTMIAGANVHSLRKPKDS